MLFFLKNGEKNTGLNIVSLFDKKVEHSNEHPSKLERVKPRNQSFVTSESFVVKSQSQASQVKRMSLTFSYWQRYLSASKRSMATSPAN